MMDKEFEKFAESLPKLTLDDVSNNTPRRDVILKFIKYRNENAYKILSLEEHLENYLKK